MSQRTAQHGGTPDGHFRVTCCVQAVQETHREKTEFFLNTSVFEIFPHNNIFYSQPVSTRTHTHTHRYETAVRVSKLLQTHVSLSWGTGEREERPRCAIHTELAFKAWGQTPFFSLAEIPRRKTWRPTPRQESIVLPPCTRSATSPRSPGKILAERLEFRGLPANLRSAWGQTWLAFMKTSPSPSAWTRVFLAEGGAADYLGLQR